MTLPPLPDRFRWIQHAWGAGLQCEPLAAVSPHVFTTRQLALSSPADARRLAEAVRARQVVMPRQVHATNVVVLRRGKDLPREPPVGDALVSDVPDLAIAVRSADCVPLLIADRARGVVAAVHAGWRGTAGRAVVAAVEALQREFGSRPADLVAAIGPAIGPCCYEVGEELMDAFAAAGHARHQIDRWFRRDDGTELASGARLRLDLLAANRDQLVMAGVQADDVHVAALCTAMHLDLLTSYRRESRSAGRIAGAIKSR